MFQFLYGNTFVFYFIGNIFNKALGPLLLLCGVSLLLNVVYKKALIEMLLQSFRVIYYYYRVIQYNINVQNIQNIQLGCFISLSDTLKQFAFGN